MKPVGVLFLATIVGCGADGSPELRNRAIGLQEETNPILVAVKVENAGDRDALVDRIEAVILAKDVVHGPSVTPPDGFDFDVQSLLELDDPANPKLRDPSQPLRIGPGERVDLLGAMTWQLPPDPPPMLALVSAKFVVRYQDENQLTTKTMAFVIQSRPGVLQHLLEREAIPDQAAAMVKVMEKMPGQRSDAFKRLLAHMRGDESRLTPASRPAN